MPKAVLLLQKYDAMLKGNCKNSFCRGGSSLLGSLDSLQIGYTQGVGRQTAPEQYTL